MREDPAQKGLLYAGTETGVFVSFNDGHQWQPLQLNLPNASVRDLAIRDNDLVAATHGRAFWILDDLTPLRQIDDQGAQIVQANAWLFRPATAWRIRPGSDEGTALPPETPTGENPPNGAILDYYLKPAPSGPVTVEILDHAGKLAHRYSSDDQPPKVDPRTLDIPAFWIHPLQPPSAEPGMHRFVWDLRYPSLPSVDQPRFGRGEGPWALPGQYTVKLTVAGRTYTQPLTVKMDPRVKTPLPDLVKQFEMARQITAALAQSSAVYREANRLRARLQSLRSQAAAQSTSATAVEALDRKTEAIMGAPPASNPDNFGVGDTSMDRTSLHFLSGALAGLENTIESADVAPTTDAIAAFRHDQQVLRTTLAQWNEVKRKDLPQLNTFLRQANLPPISLEEAHRESGR